MIIGLANDLLALGTLVNTTRGRVAVNLTV